VSKVLTLFEHETRSCDLQPEQLTHLEALQRRLPEKVLQPIYRQSQWCLRANSYVGVIRLGSLTIQILPKIYRSSAPSIIQAQEATINLLHMLNYAGSVRISESDIANLLQRESDWFEVLTYLFASHLLNAWQRGPARNYITVEDDLPLLKGKWQLNKQLQRPERAHRFAVAYDEYTIDIALNRIFRFVVERLSRLTRSSLNARTLRSLRALLDGVTLLPQVTPQDVEHIHFNRLTKQYEPLLNLARLFLDQGALQIASGDTSLYAFIFNMDVVFEGFIGGFLQRYRATAIPDALQLATLSPQARGRQLYVAWSENKPYFRLKPDLVFHENQSTLLIVDTKYKRLNPCDRKLGISEADFYQMLVYARRYSCPRVILLYPQTAEMNQGTG
jgi:5-methylcytosine-specific restriction enzyme subunit McrC